MAAVSGSRERRHAAWRHVVAQRINLCQQCWHLRGGLDAGGAALPSAVLQLYATRKLDQETVGKDQVVIVVGRNEGTGIGAGVV